MDFVQKSLYYLNAMELTDSWISAKEFRNMLPIEMVRGGETGRPAVIKIGRDLKAMFQCKISNGASYLIDKDACKLDPVFIGIIQDIINDIRE